MNGYLLLYVAAQLAKLEVLRKHVAKNRSSLPYLLVLLALLQLIFQNFSDLNTYSFAFYNNFGFGNWLVIS